MSTPNALTINGAWVRVLSLSVWGTRYSFDVDTEWFRRERPGLVITQDNCSTPAEKPNLVLKVPHFLCADLLHAGEFALPM